MVNRRIVSVVLLLFALVAVTGCLRESEKSIQKKMTVILDDDLRTIVAEIPAQGRLDKPYYKIDLYNPTPEGLRYTHQAIVSFYYLKDIKMKQVRKYRFVPMQGQWERYFKEVQYNLSDSK